VRRSTAIKVYDYEVGGAQDYAYALATLWAKGHDLMVVEQDMAPELGQVAELFMCPEPFCAFDYQVSKHLCWSQVKGAVGLGLARVKDRAQSDIKAMPRVPDVPWHDLASELGKRLPTVHVHFPPAVHHHHYD